MFIFMLGKIVVALALFVFGAGPRLRRSARFWSTTSPNTPPTRLLFPSAPGRRRC